MHAFFEGKRDESFYAGFLRNSVARDRRLCTYHCGSKKSVYLVHPKVVTRTIDGDLVLFFVDRDFDELISVRRPSMHEVFVTDWYSIENYLVTEEMVERIWAEILRQPTGGEDLEQVLASFREAATLFSAWYEEIAAWIVHQRRNTSTAQLNNLEMRRLFKIKADLTLERLVPEDELIRKCAEYCLTETPESWARERGAVLAELATQPSKRKIRGKCELWLLVAYTKVVRDLLVHAHSEAGRSLSAALDLTESNALEVLGPRVPLPESLRDFLARFE